LMKKKFVLLYVNVNDIHPVSKRCVKKLFIRFDENLWQSLVKKSRINFKTHCNGVIVSMGKSNTVS
jgi:uncharacterized protein YlbG (UPF0298 family)